MTPPSPLRPQRLIAALLSLAIVLAALAPSVPIPAPFARAQEEPVPSGDVIVVLEEDATRAEVRATATDEGVRPEVIFTEVIDAFTAEVTPAEAEALAADPDVAGVFADSPVYAAAQELPTGVDRIDADAYPGVSIGDGIEDSVDVDIAVLDSGIDATHPDLNVQPALGHNNCQDTGSYDADDTGHGTHVAGIAGARDNGADTVGVAPGARLHAVRVLKAGPGNPSGVGTISTLICGLEWAAANADVIDIVNMSITGGGTEGPPCGEADAAPLHTAVCATVAAGIPVVVAAGNSAEDAEFTIPATYDETIAVSAIADLDGEPGGASTGSCGADRDDTLAGYSNVGPDVDIAAPGSCIRSSRVGGGVTSKSGTSMAAPHVTGAAALYLAANPGASPADVRAWLLSAASEPQNSLVGFTGDRDDNPEPMLWLGAPDQPTMTPTNTPTATATPTSTPLPTTPYRLSGGGRSINSASYTYIRDGSLATSWKTKRFSSGPPADAFVYTDLGTPKPIGTIRWTFGEYGYADVFRIEVSNDLTSWTQITRRNGKPPGDWHEKQLTTPVTARYVRFFFENPRGDLYLGGLAEIQVWAPGEAPPFPTATPTPTPTPVLGDTGAYAIVGSTQSSNALDAGLAHDGSESTSWRTSYGIPTPSSAEARFEISSLQPIGVLSWVFNVGGRADAFTIQVSDDGAFWETVFTGTNTRSGVWQDIGLAEGTTGRFVRWRFTNPNGDAVLGSLAEVEIHPPFGAGGHRDSTLTPSATPSATTTLTESATPTETPTVLPTGSPELTQTPTEPPVEASPIAGDETTTPVPIETVPPAVEPEPVTTIAGTNVPSATLVSSPVPPTPTPPEGLVSASTDAAAEPTAAATVPSAIATATPTATPTTTPTTENREPRTGRVLVVGVRRTANSANGWTALDDDPSTVWRTVVSPPGRLAILTLDLGAPVAVDALRVLVADGGFAGALTVEVSEDLTTWSAVATPSPADLPAGAWATLPLDAPAAARYVRLVVVNPGPLDALAGVAELQVLPATP